MPCESNGPVSVVMGQHALEPIIGGLSYFAGNRLPRVGKEISEGDAWRAEERCAANRIVPSGQRFPRANDSTSLIV